MGLGTGKREKDDGGRVAPGVKAGAGVSKRGQPLARSGAGGGGKARVAGGAAAAATHRQQPPCDAGEEPPPSKPSGIIPPRDPRRAGAAGAPGGRDEGAMLKFLGRASGPSMQASPSRARAQPGKPDAERKGKGKESAEDDEGGSRVGRVRTSGAGSTPQPGASRRQDTSPGGEARSSSTGSVKRRRSVTGDSPGPLKYNDAQIAILEAHFQLEKYVLKGAVQELASKLDGLSGGRSVDCHSVRLWFENRRKRGQHGGALGLTACDITGGEGGSAAGSESGGGDEQAAPGKETAPRFMHKCWECRRGKFLPWKPSIKQCRSAKDSDVQGALAHTGPNWFDDERERSAGQAQGAGKEAAAKAATPPRLPSPLGDAVAGSGVAGSRGRASGRASEQPEDADQSVARDGARSAAGRPCGVSPSRPGHRMKMPTARQQSVGGGTLGASDASAFDKFSDDEESTNPDVPGAVKGASSVRGRQLFSSRRGRGGDEGARGKSSDDASESSGAAADAARATGATARGRQGSGQGGRRSRAISPSLGGSYAKASPISSSSSSSSSSQLTQAALVGGSRAQASPGSGSRGAKSRGKSPGPGHAKSPLCKAAAAAKVAPVEDEAAAVVGEVAEWAGGVAAADMDASVQGCRHQPAARPPGKVAADMDASVPASGSVVPAAQGAEPESHAGEGSGRGGGRGEGSGEMPNSSSFAAVSDLQGRAQAEKGQEALGEGTQIRGGGDFLKRPQRSAKIAAHLKMGGGAAHPLAAAPAPSPGDASRADADSSLAGPSRAKPARASKAPGAVEAAPAAEAAAGRGGGEVRENHGADEAEGAGHVAEGARVLKTSHQSASAARRVRRGPRAEGTPQQGEGAEVSGGGLVLALGTSTRGSPAKKARGASGVRGAGCSGAAGIFVRDGSMSVPLPVAHAASRAPPTLGNVAFCHGERRQEPGLALLCAPAASCVYVRVCVCLRAREHARLINEDAPRLAQVRVQRE